MSHSLRLERFPDSERNLAPVVSISTIRKAIPKKKKYVPKEAAKKELPPFYTEPIFKAKKHDFL
jgi:hypothetical protein